MIRAGLYLLTFVSAVSFCGAISLQVRSEHVWDQIWWNRGDRRASLGVTSARRRLQLTWGWQDNAVPTLEAGWHHESEHYSGGQMFFIRIHRPTIDWHLPGTRFQVSKEYGPNLWVLQLDDRGLIVAFLLVPLIGTVATGVALYKRRRRTGTTRLRCLKCGYDLRATPMRCPECGTSVC